MTNVARLGDHVEILSGFAYDSAKFGDTGDLPLVRIRDVVPGRSKTYFSGSYEPRFLVHDGDLLIGMDGEFNRGTWRGGEALLNQRVCKLTARDGLCERYLFHFLPRALKAIEDATPFATVKHLSAKTIREIAIPLPPVPEQRRIAAILDHADELRAKRRSAIALLDGLMDALFTSMFGDARARVASSWSVKLSDVARIKSGSTPDRKRPDYFGGGIPWVKTTEVHGDRILSTGESVSDAGRKSARLQLFPADSIVIAMYGQGKTRGQSAVLGIDATVNQACAVILPSEKFHVDFMAQQLRLSYERLRAKAQGGNQANLNLQLVGDLDVLVPPIAEQNLFAGNAMLLRELRNHNSLALSKLDELFASLQHRAFSGHL